MTRTEEDRIGAIQTRAYRLTGICVAVCALATKIDDRYGTLMDRPVEDFAGLAGDTAALRTSLEFIRYESDEISASLDYFEIMDPPVGAATA